MVKQFIFTISVAACLVTSGSVDLVQAQDTTQAKSSLTKVNIDLIHHGDVLDIDVVGGFEFDWRGTLTPEGFLDGYSNFADPVHALCRTETEVADAVAKSLSSILREPVVKVKIVDRSGRPEARLQGAIRTPMRFSVRRITLLQEILIAAGGLTDEASGEITVFRSGTAACLDRDLDGAKITDAKYNGTASKVIKLSDLLSGKADANPVILSGDLITVERALPVYMIGAIENPRPLYTRERMTLSRAIATAGGLTKDGDPSAVTIYRKVVGKTTVIEADLNKIRIENSLDIHVEPFDIIEVGSRGATKRKFAPIAETTIEQENKLVSVPLRILD